MRRFSRRAGVSTIIGSVIVFGMLLTIGLGYFTFVTQNEQNYLNVALQNDNALNLRVLQHFSVYGAVSNNYLIFSVNNSGPSAEIVAYWIFNATNMATISYQDSALSSYLPFAVNQGQNYVFTKTNVLVTNPSQKFVIKVLSARGTTAIGVYPSGQITPASVNSLVAGGFGSLSMTFSTFTWYDYTSGPPSQDTDTDYTELCANALQCNGGKYVIDIKHPHSGSLLPQGQNHTQNGCSYCGIMVPIAFSVNITNNDPSRATMVLNSETNLWVIQTCSSGRNDTICSNGNPIYVFYLMNVASNGTILSTNQGSFVQVTIPFNVTKTLYYGASSDLALNSYSPLSLSSDDSTVPGNNLAYYGEFAVFLLFAGTKVLPTGTSVYGQNIPFESTISADNLGWYAESPTSCKSNSQSTFQLEVNNSAFSGNPINKVVVNGSAFTSVAGVKPSSGWNAPTLQNGVITWTPTNSGLNPGLSQNFSWSGTAPKVTQTSQVIIPILLYWTTGQVTLLQVASACFVNP